MKRIPLPTSEFLHALFCYNPNTGVLRYRKTDQRVAPRQRARHQMVYIDRRNYFVHRLSWRMVTGDDPADMEIDHKNGQGNDNRWHNLRLATSSQNLQNRRMHRRNSTGFKGVCFDKNKKRYVAQIGHQSKTIYLGVFDDAEAAHLAYVAAAVRLHGEFARFS